MEEEPDDKLLTNPETLTAAQAEIEQYRPANSCESYKLITAQADAAHAMATEMLAEMQEFKILWRPWAFFVDTFVANLGASEDFPPPAQNSIPRVRGSDGSRRYRPAATG